jgi:hypothetical protein
MAARRDERRRRRGNGGQMADAWPYATIAISAYLLGGCVTGLLVSYVTTLTKTLENPPQVQMTALALVLGWPEVLFELLAWKLGPRD